MPARILFKYGFIYMQYKSNHLVLKTCIYQQTQNEKYQLKKTTKLNKLFTTTVRTATTR